MSSTWRNWAGLAEARPREVVTPGSPDEVAEAVSSARRRGLRVKMPGSGHSFTDIAVSDGVLLDPGRLRGVTAVDRSAMTVTVLAGTPLHELNAALERLGLALHNMGDIDRQTVAGATSTGTHGTGGVVASLSEQLEAVQIVAGDATLHSVSRSGDPELFAAARLGLGALGVLTSLTFKVEPAFVVRAEERPMRWEEAVGRFEELVEDHHHVDLYWFPHTDGCLAKLNDRTIDAADPLSAFRRGFEDELLSNTLFGLVNRACTRWPSATRRVNQVTSRVLGARTYSDQSHRVFVSPRRIRFREMEYAVPRPVGMTALAEVRELIDRSAWNIVFPVEVRATPPDGAWLSTAHERPSVYLAFHVGHDTDHTDYFREVERVLASYDGRPHWGKLHTRTAADLAPAYPRWLDFTRVREQLDPDRIFGNAYLDRVLG